MGRRVWRLPSPPTSLQNTTESPTSLTSPLSPLNSNPNPARSSHNSSTSTSTSNSNSKTTNTPLTPPPRLHLRTIIPSPPLPPEYLTTAPPLPYPWIWKCHLCNSIYRLGVTRRCLEDGHLFCSLPSPPSPPITPTLSKSTSSSSSSEKKNEKEQNGENENGENERAIVKAMKKAKAKRRRDKKRAATRGCRAEFDYGGWSKYNIWRREVRNLKGERKRDRSPFTRSRTRGVRDAGREDGKGRVWSSEWEWEKERERDEDIDSIDFESKDEEERAGRTTQDRRGRRGRGEGWRWDGPGGGRDCWRDCDFPSECHNERKAERDWEARMREMRKWDEEWRERVLGVALGESDAIEGRNENENGSGNGKRRKSSEEPGEESMVSVGGRDGHGDWDDDGDGDTVMTDADMDIESEEDADRWSDYIPSSGSGSGSKSTSRNHNHTHTHNIPIGLAITTNTARSAHYPSVTEEKDIDFTFPPSEDENLGPLGMDCDGLGEASYQLNYTQSRRRKSVEGLLGDSPPSSPLKECSFGFEDLVGADLGLDRRVEGDGDSIGGEGCEVWRDDLGQQERRSWDRDGGEGEELRGIVTEFGVSFV